MEQFSNGQGKCPFSNAGLRHTAAATHSNSKWWPNQLNLKILHQNAAEAGPY